jgi:hypothetical protein
MDDRNFIGHFGKVSSHKLGVFGGATSDLCDHAGHHVTKHGQDVSVAGDEGDLGIERDIFGEMAHSVVWLSSKHRSGLIDAFKDSDHDLLIELRRLRQVRRSTEVVDDEDFSPGLSRVGDELGRLNLGEVLLI